ncbi:hypothetical protein D3C76_911140 [compost metagenome]
MGLFFAQWFGGDDVAAGGQDFAAEFRVEVIEVGIATQHQGLGAHRALGGMDLDLGAIVDAGHGRVLEQLDPQSLCRCGFAQGQVQWMQVPRTHVDQATHIARGADHGVHLVGLQQTGLVAITEAAQFFGILGEAFKVTGLVGEVAVTPGQVAGDLEALDPLPDDFHGFQAHEFHLPNTFDTDDVGELIEAVADAANQLPAIASTGAPADSMGFKQHYAEAAFGQLKRRVQPRKPTAHHTDIGQHFAFERRKFGLRQAAGGVVGGDVVRSRLLSTRVHVRDPGVDV